MKKWLSAILLCAGILLAMLPIRASAAAATTVTITGGVCITRTSSYAMYAKNIVITGGKVTVAAGSVSNTGSRVYHSRRRFLQRSARFPDLSVPETQAYISTKKKLTASAQHFCTDSVSFFFVFRYASFTFRHLIAFSTAMTMTPTSAKIAAHMFAIPIAPRIRHTAFTTRANTIFS